MSDRNLIGVFLYRSNTGSVPIYGEQRTIREWAPWTIIGVATRPAGKRICTGGTRDRERFMDEVETIAIQWEWLDTEMET